MAKFRKRFTQKEAEGHIENTMQMRSVYLENLFYWKNSKETRADKLIQALCNQSKEEMMLEAEKKLEYIERKLDYLFSFSPNYVPKGSFGM